MLGAATGFFGACRDGTWTTIAKDLLFRERFGAPFMFQFSNVLNHVRFADPTLSLANPSTFGVITRSAAGSTTIPLYTPRQLEFGVRFHF